MLKEIKKTLFGKPKTTIELQELYDALDQIFQVKEDKLTYILLKDLPFLKKGTKITYSENDHGFVTTTPIKLLQEYEGHYLEWFMKEVYENPEEYKDFIKLIR